MSITAQCGGCQKRFKVGDQFSGRKVRCKSCGGVILVPEASAVAVVETATTRTAPSGKAPAAKVHYPAALPAHSRAHRSPSQSTRPVAAPSRPAPDQNADFYADPNEDPHAAREALRALERDVAVAEAPPTYVAPAYQPRIVKAPKPKGKSALGKFNVTINGKLIGGAVLVLYGVTLIIWCSYNLLGDNISGYSNRAMSLGIGKGILFGGWGVNVFRNGMSGQ